MNTRPTPETDAFFATFADGEAAPSHAEYYARLQDLERERDEARDENGTWKQIARGRISKIAEVTTQRDRLAEALEDIRARCQEKTLELHLHSDAKGCVDDCLEWSEQALQSLTPKS